MVLDMKERAKLRCVTEFLHAEKSTFVDAYGDQTVDGNTLKRCVMRLSSDEVYVVTYQADESWTTCIIFS